MSKKIKGIDLKKAAAARREAGLTQRLHTRVADTGKGYNRNKEKEKFRRGVYESFSEFVNKRDSHLS